MSEDLAEKLLALINVGATVAFEAAPEDREAVLARQRDGAREAALELGRSEAAADEWASDLDRFVRAQLSLMIASSATAGRA